MPAHTNRLEMRIVLELMCPSSFLAGSPAAPFVKSRIKSVLTFVSLNYFLNHVSKQYYHQPNITEKVYVQNQVLLTTKANCVEF